ncbi:MAG: primosomal protein N' [Bacillota bacterium]|nr:primosomal protein N' [Bacillota bacterium]
MKIAEVILNTEVKSLDRVYHYLVPEGMEIAEGARVEVPFGTANRRNVGYFIGYIQKSPFEGLKEIYSVIDKMPLIPQKGIELARYIRRTCLCSMSESIRLLLPPAVNFKFEKIVSLTNTDGNEGKLTPLQKTVLENLKAAGGSAEQKKLLESCKVKSSAVISSLEKRGLVRMTEKPVGGTKEKLRKKVFLSVPPEEAEQFDKLGKGMKKALEMLARYESMLLSELIEYSGCSSSSVYLLESRGLVTVEDIEVKRSPVNKEIEKTESLLPTHEQKRAIETVKQAIDSDAGSEHLLFGVTGSGKTEVFLQGVDYCISKGKNAVILVPEIALTPQMTTRFISRFGDNVAVLHSGLSLGERYDEWRRIRSGEVNVVVGARSAIFAPFDNIGLIVIDEEHETTYKSENSPRYDARKIGQYRAIQNKCPIIYASATPRVEDYYKAVNGKINLIELTHRFNNQEMPEVFVADMAAELAGGNRSVYSDMAQRELEKNTKTGHQSIIFLNRRGYSTFVSCRSCGYVAKCPNCSVSLTYHSNGNTLKCHMCGHTVPNPTVCPECGSKYIRYFGAGTQKAEEELKEIFPSATLVRMDADTTMHKFSHERILNKFNDEKIDFLLGTQMITKGLDFPNVTLSVVLAADTLINTGDYRALERAFSQLVQVCGRAGRGKIKGRAVIQTYEPQNKVIAYAKKNDYTGFYQDEIKSRKIMEYPPFADIISVIISGKDEKGTGEYGMEAEKYLRNLLGHYSDLCITFFGLAPAATFKVKNKYRYRILLKTRHGDEIYGVLEQLYNKHIDNKTKFGMEIDVNPNNCL